MRRSFESVATEANTPFVGGAIPQEDLKNDYNFFKVPADLNEAKKHGIANRVYVQESELKRTLNPNKVCKCCNHKKGVKIPLCAGLDAMYHLGSGHVLYFRFVKYAVGMLILMLMVGGVYNLVTNVKEGDCTSEDIETNEDAYCIKGYILSFTLQNKRDSKDLLKTQLILNLATVVLIMFFFHYLRYQFRKMNKSADAKTVKPSDYTVEVQNIPLKATNEEIEQWVARIAGKDQTMEIERILRPYSINEYIDLVFNKSNLEAEKRRDILKIGRKRSLKEEEDIKKKDMEIQKVVEKIQDLKNNDLTKCPFVYITFKYPKQAKVMTRFEKSLFDKLQGMFVQYRDYACHQFGETEVRVRRAPEPTDIMWRNLKFDREKKVLSKFVVFMLTLMMIIVSLIIILIVNWLQGKASVAYGQKDRLVQILSLVASVVISLTNVILGVIVTYGSKFERHWSYSHYLRNVAHKLTIAQFLNTALSSLFAQIILSRDDSISNTLQKINFYGKGGLLENIYYVFLLNAIFMALMTIVDPVYIAKVVQRYFVNKQGSNNKLTQMEANLLFEGPTIDMPDKYAAIIKIVLMTTFYSPAIPFTLLIAILGLCLLFWVDKYMLLRRMAFPRFLNNETTESMIEYLEWAAATFSVGNLIYVYTLKNSQGELAFASGHNALAWVTFLVSMLHVNLPMEAVNKKLFPTHKKPHVHPEFQAAREKFRTDYDNELFLSSIVSLKEPIKQLLKSKDSQFKNFLQRIYGKVMFGSHQSQVVKNLPSEKVTIPVEEEAQDEDLEYLDNFMGNIQKILNKNEAQGSHFPTPMLGKVTDACLESESSPKKNSFSGLFYKCLGIGQNISPSPKSGSKPTRDLIKSPPKGKQEEAIDICQIEIKEEKTKVDQEQTVLLETNRVGGETEKKEPKEILESTVSLIMNQSYLAEHSNSVPRMSAVNRELGK